MKLFGDFEAVKFPEENMILITNDEFLYYTYRAKYKSWRKYDDAGNLSLTISNYPDVSREELVNAMNGVFPQKERDFLRMCDLSTLHIGEILALFEDDYPKYMADFTIYSSIYQFIMESGNWCKSIDKLQELFDDATANQYDNNQVLAQIKKLSPAIIGRDIFKKEIEIVDGYDTSSYFSFRPARVIDYENTAYYDGVAIMRGVVISIEEDDVADYLLPFLHQHFDEELEENKMRKNLSGFECYLEHNFFTFDSMALILKDIEDTIDALITGRENEYTQKLKLNRFTATHQLVYANELNEKEHAEYNANRPPEDDAEVELIVDFYQRFLYRIEYMMKIGKEKGYNLISVMGP